MITYLYIYIYIYIYIYVYRLDFDLNVDDELASIRNVISNFSDNPQPYQPEINYDMMELPTKKHW